MKAKWPAGSKVIIDPDLKLPPTAWHGARAFLTAHKGKILTVEEHLNHLEGWVGPVIEGSGKLLVQGYDDFEAETRANNEILTLTFNSSPSKECIEYIINGETNE